MNRYAQALTAAALAVTMTGCAALGEQNEKWAERRAEREAANAARLAEEQAAMERAAAARRAMMPRCESDEECDRMWDAAQLWIADNAGMALRTATDVQLATYASQPVYRIAARAIKRPMGDGEYMLDLWAGCAVTFRECDVTDQFAAHVGRFED